LRKTLWIVTHVASSITLYHAVYAFRDVIRRQGTPRYTRTQRATVTKTVTGRFEPCNP
jgi:hypothetical protein